MFSLEYNSKKKQKYRKADGTISFQKAQSIFRFAKTGGKMTKRIPASAESTVMKMIAAGKEYGVLRNEYERILTVLSLEGTLEKSPDAPTRLMALARRSPMGCS